MQKNIADIRKDYMMHALHENDVLPNPINQFAGWWHNAVDSAISEVNAMTLATADAAGKPSARIVLLKGFSADGFVFYTNYQSQKAAELEANPLASLLFFWKELERQVRIEGRVEKVLASESDEYFASRPVLSRVGAWASPQSKPIPNRQWLEDSFAAEAQRFGDNVPRPPHWGGYLVRPVKIEFWQGRSSRLHDRILYTLINNQWSIERLAP